MTLVKDMGTLRAHFFRIYSSHIQRETIDKVQGFQVSPEIKKLLNGIGKSMAPKQIPKGGAGEEEKIEVG